MVIDEAAFKLIEQKRKFDTQTLEIGRRRLLNKERATDLQVAYGVNVARIYAIEKQIAAAIQELRLPPGWGEITIAAPKSMLVEFERQAEAALRKLSSRMLSKAVSAARGASRPPDKKSARARPR